MVGAILCAGPGVQVTAGEWCRSECGVRSQAARSCTCAASMWMRGGMGEAWVAVEWCLLSTGRT